MHLYAFLCAMFFWGKNYACASFAFCISGVLFFYIKWFSFAHGKLENCQIIALSWSECWSIMRMLIHFERWPPSPWPTCFPTTWRASTCTTGPSQNPSTALRLSRWYNLNSLCDIRHCWQWIVVKKPVYCSLAQLTPFRALLGDKGQLLGQNLPE